MNSHSDDTPLADLLAELANAQEELEKSIKELREALYGAPKRLPCGDAAPKLRWPK